MPTATSTDFGQDKRVYTSHFGVIPVCALFVYVYVHARRRTRYSLNCLYLHTYQPDVGRTGLTLDAVKCLIVRFCR